MRHLILIPVLSIALSGCANPLLIPPLISAAVGIYCSDANAPARGAIRDRAFGDPAVSILTRPDCE